MVYRLKYELVRSIKTVAQPTRKKLGIVKTDAQFMGGFSMAGGSFQQIPRQAILTELSKQYELVDIDPTQPITAEQADVLFFIAQPSSLGPQELLNVVTAVKSGIPSAIFEDPVPFGFDGIPGTGEPKPAPGGMFGGGGPPPPKGDIQQLWQLLGVRVPNKPGAMQLVDPFVVWQPYNPYPKLQRLMQATDEWIFVREEIEPEADLLSEDSPITEGLQELSSCTPVPWMSIKTART